MSKKNIIFACLVIYAQCASAAVAPFITKCRSSDSNCARNSAQTAISKFTSGIPELRVEVLDPLHYKHIDASTSDLQLILNDIDITGLKNSDITKITRDVAQSRLTVEGTCTLVLKGQYEIGGNLLFLPMQGKGKIYAKLNKLHVQVVANMDEKVKKGKKYWNVKSWTHKYELQGKAELDLENLFEGNEVLGRAARDLLKTSANEVVAEVAPPIVKALLTKVVKNVDKFFNRVPAEELAIDY